MDHSGEEYSSSGENDYELTAKKTTKTQGADRISHLPDGIILHILSFLPTMDDVIRTGALSRRWQYLWTSVPTLNFSLKKQKSTSGRVIKKQRQEFASFISNTLIQCHHTKLKRFRLCFETEQRFAFQLNLWIRYAVGANVEELDLDLPGYEQELGFELPQHLFINSSIKNLKLRNVVVQQSLSVNWKMLNRLSISNVELNDEVIHNIVLGSPVLVSIEFCDCFGFTSLDITSKSIRRLVLKGFGPPRKDTDDAILKISAPYIWSLDIRGDLRLRRLQVLDLSSLITANLDFNAPSLIKYYHDYPVSSLYKDLWKGLLQCLGHVHELAIGHCGIKVLTLVELESRPSLLSKCKTLKINGLEKRGFPGLAKLLQHSPALKSLFIQPKSSPNLHFYHYYHYHRSDDVVDANVTGGNYWASKKTQFQCQHQSLKNVKIVYDFKRDDECELIQFLLENARGLEKMIIDAGSKGGRLSSSQASLLKVTRKLLLQFPRASKHAVLLLEGFQQNESY